MCVCVCVWRNKKKYYVDTPLIWSYDSPEIKYNMSNGTRYIAVATSCLAVMWHLCTILSLKNVKVTKTWSQKRLSKRAETLPSVYSLLTCKCYFVETMPILYHPGQVMSSYLGSQFYDWMSVNWVHVVLTFRIFFECLTYSCNVYVDILMYG